MPETDPAPICKVHVGVDSAFAALGKWADGEATRGPFERPGWFQALHRHCFADRTPLIAEARCGSARALLPLVRTGGGSAQGLSNWYSFTFGPIFANAADEVTKLRLIGAMAEALRSRCRRLTVEPVANDNGAVDLIRNGFRQGGWLTYADDVTVNHFLSVDGRTFDEYWAARPGQLRNTVKRKAKKNRVSLRIERAFDTGDWADYERVYASSWKPAEDSMAFLAAFARAEGAEGRLRLGLAHVDGVCVAAQLWTVENGVAYIHKLAHVEDADRLSPGTLLSAALFQHVIDVDGARTIDFGTGDDAYKTDWMEERRSLSRIELFRPEHPLNWPAIARRQSRGLVRSRRSR